MDQFVKGILFILLSSIATSTSTIVRGESIKILNPFIMLSFGSLLGAVVLLTILLLTGRRLNISKVREDLHDFILLVVSRGLIGDILFMTGLTLTSGVKVIFLTKAEPYFILLWGWIILRERVRRSHVLLLMIHIIGAIVLSTGLSFKTIGGPQLGDLLILFALASSSFSYFSATKFTKKIGAIQSNALLYTFTWPIFMVFAVFFSKSSVWHYSQGWTDLIVGSLLYNVLGLTLWFASLAYVKGWMASALRSVGPFIVAPIAVMFFGQSLTFVQVIGGIIVLITSVLIAKEHKTSVKAEPVE